MPARARTRSSVRRTSAIRVPSGEILNAVTFGLQQASRSRCGLLSGVNIHIRCRPPCCPMSQISPYLVNCGLSSSVAPLSKSLVGSPPAYRCSTQRRPIVRRDGKVGVRHRHSHRVDGVLAVDPTVRAPDCMSANRLSCVTCLTAPRFDRVQLLPGHKRNRVDVTRNRVNRNHLAVRIAPGTRYGCWFTLITTPFTPPTCLRV